MREKSNKVSVVIYHDGGLVAFDIPKGAIPTDGIGSVFTKDKFGNWVADNRTKK